MHIYSVEDSEFKSYGNVWDNVPSELTSPVLEALSATPIPEGSKYVASAPELEGVKDADKLGFLMFGGRSFQLGWCNGHNTKLNCLEYHRDSEINIAVTDLILILGKEQDITEDHTYDSSKMEAFLIPAGTTIEVYATTLHYAPCNVAASGFKCVVVLPKGTNTDITLEEKHTPEDDLLFARNKWLLSHPDANIAGSVAGIKGENLSVK